ncbi:hypothetical protein PQR39_25720 [Paraburkholderia sediminicola]|uniref:hypothetical protein n=1 Tax=Paraburkholderia sediminicola TaxID=458836 RepID=UPI0038BD0D23
MEFNGLLEQIQIEGTGEGDVVFVAMPADMRSDDFVKFANALRSTADRDRADGKFFPRCIVMPPGVTVEVARAQSQDRIEIVGDETLSDQLAASPDAGVPHG